VLTARGFCVVLQAPSAGAHNRVGGEQRADNRVFGYDAALEIDFKRFAQRCVARELQRRAGHDQNRRGRRLNRPALDQLQRGHPTRLRSGKDGRMPTFKSSVSIEQPPEAVFEFVSDVRTLPRYYDGIRSVEPLEGGAVRVTSMDTSSPSALKKPFVSA